MVKSITLLFTFVYTTYAEAAKSYHDYQVWKVWTNSTAGGRALYELQDKLLVDLWSVVSLSNNEHTLMSLHTKDIPTIIDQLEKYDVKYSVHSTNLQRMIDSSFTSNSSGLRADKFDLYKYNQFPTIMLYLTEVSKKHSGIVKYKNIGLGALQKNPMIVLEIDIDRKKEKKDIFVDCGMHPREYITISFCLYLIHMLTEERTNPKSIKILKDYTVHILAVYNPDGYIHTWEKIRLWRKNLSPTKNPSCPGVDLNRNFDIEFGKVKPTTNPCMEDYQGETPNSEKENVNAITYIKNIGDVIAYFNIHSFSQRWMFPYGYSSALPSNMAKLSCISLAAIAAIKLKHKESYEMGRIYSTVYAASGSAVDFFYDKLNIKLSFALELRDKGKDGFLLPEDKIKPSVEEVFDGFSMAVSLF